MANVNMPTKSHSSTDDFMAALQAGSAIYGMKNSMAQSDAATAQADATNAQTADAMQRRIDKMATPYSSK